MYRLKLNAIQSNKFGHIQKREGAMTHPPQTPLV